MQKNIIIIFLSFIIILLLSIIFINKDKNNFEIIHEIENIIYDYKILPILNFIEKNENYKEIEYNNLLKNAWIKQISIYDNELRIYYLKNYTPKAFFCTYIYSKDKFNHLDIWKTYTDSSLFEEYWAIFSRWKLSKINNNYAKYCLYHLF